MFPRSGIQSEQRARSSPSQVFQASLKVLKMLLTQYVPKHKLSKLETAHCVERTVPVLLARTGDSAARLRVLASNFIQVRRAQVRAAGDTALRGRTWFRRGRSPLLGAPASSLGPPLDFPGL